MAKRKSPELAVRLGKNMAQRRKELGITQESLAEYASVDAETISRFERGVTTPSLKTLEVLAARLGVTIGALLDEGEVLPCNDAQVISSLISGLKSKERSFLLELIQLYCRQHG